MLTKDNRRSLIIAFEALLLTLLFHGVLLILFVPPPPTMNVANQQLKRISMFQINRDSDYAASMRKWFEYADPTLISKPSKDSGYGVLTHYGGLRKDLLGAATPEFNSGKEVDFMICKDLQELNAELLTDNMETLPEFKMPVAIKDTPARTYPYAIIGDGGGLPDIFVEKSSVDVLMQKYKALRNSVIIVEKAQVSDAIPRFRITQSCGVTELDREAVRRLVSSDIVRDKLAAGRVFPIIVVWADSYGKPEGAQ
jgi:hypothetical protein